MFLVDACVVLNYDEGHASKRIFDELIAGNKLLALTDFTLLEIEHHAAHRLKRELEEAPIKIVETGVRPGEWDKERAYERLVDPEIARIVPDPSDAVLVAAAEKFNAGIITRDRHHIYTHTLYDYLQKKNIEVLKPGDFVREYFK